MNDAKKSYTGCLIGCAVGDTVGAPVEMKNSLQCQSYIMHHMVPKKFENVWRIHGPHKYEFGQYTDDTQLTRELLISLVEGNGRFVPENYADRIANIFARDQVVGYGGNTKKAAVRLINGEPWHLSGTPSPAAGNGSAMRAAPIGLVSQTEDDLIQDTVRQGIMTHANTICSAGALAISGAIYLLKNWDVAPTEQNWWKKLATLVARIDTTFGMMVLQVWDSQHQPKDFMARAYAKLGATGYKGFHNSVVVQPEMISAYVVPSVLWSLYSFLTSPDNFWQTIQTAIYPGGDVDSTAAMAGAISGFYNGVDAIPIEVTQKIHDQGTWKYDELVELALQLEALVNDEY